MTKQEIKDQLQAKGLLETTGSRDTLWIKAFDEYNKANPGKALKISSCGSCYNEVRKWLKA